MITAVQPRTTWMGSGRGSWRLSEGAVDNSAVLVVTPQRLKNQFVKHTKRSYTVWHHARHAAAVFKRWRQQLLVQPRSFLQTVRLQSVRLCTCGAPQSRACRQLMQEPALTDNPEAPPRIPRPLNRRPPCKHLRSPSR